MMRAAGWKWMVGALALTLVFAVGCAKKQTVSGTAPGTAMTAPPPEQPPETAQENIVSQPVKPEQPLTTAQREAEAGVAVTREAPSSFPDIHFDFDQSLIRDDAKPVLQQVADAMKQNPQARLRIEGYCDERGTAEYNLALGERRAVSAKDYLVSLGVSAGRISTVSFGEEKPIDPGHNEEAWAKNRRDHFVLQ